jgi:uncharacterized cupin superfamily protein
MHRIAHVHPLLEDGDGAASDAAPERVLAGSGFARTWNAFSDASGRFHAGLWRHGPGVLAVDYAEAELCVILEGRVRLTSEDGSVEFEEGEAFVIAPGFRGTWESVGRVTKAYAVLEP